MDEASSPDESRERAVSSEPCSTRPNPFDETESLSRKRRRTSLNGASRSRSVDTVNSPPASSVTTREFDLEAQDDSTMKIDTDPSTPHTPEQQIPQGAPPSEPRSSRVTINVRTPSRPLEVIPSSPPSSKDSVTIAPPTPDNEVKVSVEESEQEGHAEDTTVDTPGSSTSDTGSPPVELVSVQPDHENDHDVADAGQPAVALQQTIQQLIIQDPTLTFPFRDPGESLFGTIERLVPYIPTHEQVSRDVSQWIERWLQDAKTAPVEVVFDSLVEHQDIWLNLPQLVDCMTNRKSPYPRGGPLRSQIILFYRSFARLTAYFLNFDLRVTRLRLPADPSRLNFMSLPYIQSLSCLTRKEEVALQDGQVMSSAGGTEDEWKYAQEAAEILEIFQHYNVNNGGSLAYLGQLAQFEIAHISRIPKLTDSLGHICILAWNIVRESYLWRANNLYTQVQAQVNCGRGYLIFRDVSAALSNIVEKHINHLSHDSATNIIFALTEIYRRCIDMGKVSSDVIQEHRQNHPPVHQQHLAEAMAYDWRFTMFTKLIMSSQMQLRVMAVTTMCTDLVNFWRLYNEPRDDMSHQSFLRFIADFLLRTGLVAYILGPTCHPEITIESSNIVGFLLVSSTYTNEHTDALWKTFSSTQDPRISDALIRMMNRIAQLFRLDGLMYLCEKLNTVPVEGFNPTLREFCDNVLTQLRNNLPDDRSSSDVAPYELCIRLIRESSKFGSQSPVAFPELQQFAANKLRDLLNVGPAPESRQGIFQDCLKDIKRKSPTSLGSLWVIWSLTRHGAGRELRQLIEEHELARLLIEEIEAAIPAAHQAGFPAVLSSPQNIPRKELITFIILQHPESITQDLGRRLWDVLVGVKAACREDREIAWNLLNMASKRASANGNGGNPYVSICFSEYLPSLTPECFCTGTLEFVREALLPVVNDPGSITLDEGEGAEFRGIEQLWRIILTAPERTIEQQAIHTLVKDIYIESPSIKSFPHYRARKVHLALVDRCLRQLSSAAGKLRSFSDGTSSGDDEPMVIVATDQQVHQQELLFIRSLFVLREFHWIHQGKPHFSAPDLRLLIAESPSEVEGDSAELKYQSFDGDVQTSVRPLSIGKRNTAGSLLASLRDATGFENYRIYYRGKPFLPLENEICKPLEDLQIGNGIILVKREDNGPISPTRIRPGASSIEVEILGHFKELWEYLNMEEKVAREVYGFLTRLPADENLLLALNSSTTSYKDIFPLGQPFRSLYAVHAIRDYLGSHQPRNMANLAKDHDANPKDASSDHAAALLRTFSLVVAALSDTEVIASCPSPDLQTELSSTLVDCFVRLLKDPSLPVSSSKLLDAHLLDRLMEISLANPLNTDIAIKQTLLCVEGIFQCCSRSSSFWAAFCAHRDVSVLLSGLLLHDSQAPVRAFTADLIKGKSEQEPSASDGELLSFRDFFWPMITSFIGPALEKPVGCVELLELCLHIFKTLRQDDASILSIKEVLEDWSQLLLSYTTFEDVTQPDLVDYAATCLVHLLHTVLCSPDFPVDLEALPAKDIPRKLFWKHLFPPFEDSHEGFLSQDASIRPILHENTRRMLVEVLCSLVDKDLNQLEEMLEDLNSVVPYYPDEEGENYAYDLPPQFERARAIRAPCGYVGLKNLSNTCYLNSLFTQLFMNVQFRQFMVSAEIRDAERTQSLLFQTQKLFGFLQGSIRRFITPEECVCTIKTYEDTQIDIHNQMDVDEFYNLLFDRWEGQLFTSEAKRQFRSFYGGQLVQQVKSQECDHISERLEPFSAIQCDIKGKNNLRESLQAYVDGEIMQGDNKYKCSTCDRHVDAVKRACLKDIPDNLIFHLKRFDFNLRTLQRSKINDYFTFPTKIDMHPYTMEHLSDPAGHSSEDVFELVGVLVHSGTAESGHYYSYIRERPSKGEPETWLEFNDDVVTSWDPSLMEPACYGGPDYRPPFESNGVVYDKTYSAYMLFYQRASTLTKERVPEYNYVQPGKMQQRARSGPFQVPLKPEMAMYIQRENVSLLRRHCLFDPAQVPFVQKIMDSLRSLYGGQCSEDHDVEEYAMMVALSHYDQVASRVKDTPDAEVFIYNLTKMCRSCVHCSIAVCDYFKTRHEAWRALTQRNPEADIRSNTGQLVLMAMHKIKTSSPEVYGSREDDRQVFSREEEMRYSGTILHGVMGMIRYLLDYAHQHIRSWPEVFGFMLSVVRMGPLETAVFIREKLLKALLLIICADPNLAGDIPQQYVRLGATVSRRLPTRPPAYEEIIGLLDHLLSRMFFRPLDETRMFSPDFGDRFIQVTDGSDARFSILRPEQKILNLDWSRGPSNIFMEKLININQNPEATLSILTNLIKLSRDLESRLFKTLKVNITGQMLNYPVAPFLQVASAVFCRYASQSTLIRKLIVHVCEQCMNLQNGEGMAFLEFQKDVFDGPRENSGETADDILLFGLERLPDWAPGLLGYFNTGPSNETEMFLVDKLFSHGPSPAFDDEDSQLRAMKMVEAGRTLGMRCLFYLRDNYVNRRAGVAAYLVAGLERVVKECAKYYSLQDSDGDPVTQEFFRLNQAVMDALRRLKVDELEDDASDWENSSEVCSEQMDRDSIGDISMQATGDLQDGDLQ